MAYIGQSIKNGTFTVLDTSGNTYNGSNTTFSLGTQVGSAAQLLVSHDGVIQKPGTDFTLATGGTQITFTTAPASGAAIFIVEISGAVGGTITPSDDSVTTSKINDNAVSFAKLDSTNQSFIKSIPQSGSAKTSSYTLTTSDIGSFIEVGSSGAITIPNSTFSAGNAISLFNNTTGNITITCSITTAYIAGANTDESSVTLATRGVATILFISGTVCVISGNVS